MKNYFKYFFSRLEHWLITLIILCVWFYALYDAGAGMLIWAIPIALYIGRSVIMYKQKKNGTTS